MAEPMKIGDIMSNNKDSMQPNRELTTSSTGISKTSNEVLKKMIVAYSEKLKNIADTGIIEPIMGNYPTLSQFANKRGRNVVIAWINYNIVLTSEFCGCKDKITPNQAKECARMILSRYYMLKTSELVLFFQKLQFGDYGHFYGSIDPQRILCALREFSEWRNIIIEQEEGKQREQKRKQEQENLDKSWANYRGGLAAYRKLRDEGVSHEDALNRLRIDKDEEEENGAVKED